MNDESDGHQSELERLRSIYRWAKAEGRAAIMADCQAAHKTLGAIPIDDIFEQRHQARMEGYRARLADWYARWDAEIRRCAPNPVAPSAVPGCPDWPG
jgi:hypothetical protein